MTSYRIASFLIATFGASVSACAVGVADEGPPSESVEQSVKPKICPAIAILCLEGYQAKSLPGCKAICVPNHGGGSSPCDAVKCEAGTHCEEVQVQCITTPCDPIAQCVPDTQCSGSQTYNSETGQCECNAVGLCIEGYTWDSAACDCVPVSTPKCIVTGCSGQICASEDVITTCEWKPEYACYQNATCEVQANGACGWTQTADLQACLQQNGI